MSTALTPVKQVCQAIASPDFKATLQQALPPNVSIDRFIRTAMTGIQQNPAVCEADRQSLYLAIQRCASDGLMPDNREAALAIYGGKVNYMPMVLGIIKRLATAGITIDAQVVRANDDFEQEFGDDARIVHKAPRLGQDRGELIGAYAIAKLPNGMVMREVMDKAQIEQVRMASRSANGGPWKQWYDEMARKTVLRRLAKRLPILDASVADTVNADDDMMDFAAGNAAASDTPPPQQPAAQAGPRRPRGLHVVAAAAEQVDTSTGEILEGESHRIDDEQGHTDDRPGDEPPHDGGDF